MTRRWMGWLPIIALFLAPLLIYWGTYRYDFVTFDDGLHVYSNSLIVSPAEKALPRIWSRPYQGLYVPLTYTAWWLQARLSETLGLFGSAAVFHVVNVVLHSLNTVLVFLLLGSLGATALGAAAGALLFAWHPLQVEAVAWISSLKDLLCGTFLLLALLSHVRARYAYSGALFVLALLAKPAAIVFPALVALLDLAILARPIRQAWRVWALWLALALPIAYVTKSVQPDSIMPFHVPWPSRALIAGDALLFYLSKIFFPWFLSLNYGRTPQAVLNHPISAFGWILPAGILLFLWYRRASVPLSAGVLFLLIYLSPVLGFVPFYYQKYSTVADRFIYVGMFGVSLALAFFLSRPTRVRIALVMLALAWFFVKSSQQLPVWECNRTLVKQIARVNPSDPDIHYSIGLLLAEESHGAEQTSYLTRLLRAQRTDDPSEKDQKYEAAVFHLREAIRLNPEHASAHNNLGMLYHRRGFLSAATDHFRRALEIDPTLAESQNNLGVALALQGRDVEAVSAFVQAFRLAPADPTAPVNYGISLEKMGRLSAAEEQYRLALRLSPGHTLARLQLEALEKKKREVDE